MNNRRHQQLLETASPLLIAGEQVELTSLVKVGSVSLKRKVLTAAVVGALTAGTVIATARPVPMYLLMTDQRMLFFDGTTLTGKPGKLLMVFPREIVTASPAASGMLGLIAKTVVTVEGQERGLKLLFPFVTRKDARELTDRLPVTP